MTAKKKPAAKTTKAPEVVKIAWHNRPITWGLGCLFVLLLIVSAISNMGGPEVVKAEPFELAKTETPVVVVKPEPVVRYVRVPQIIEVPKIVKVREVVEVPTTTIKAESGAVVVSGSRNVRIDRSISVDRRTYNRTTNRQRGQRDKAQNGVQSARNEDCEEYRRQHEQITAQWATMLER